jgi:hypothetical protein
MDAGAIAQATTMLQQASKAGTVWDDLCDAHSVADWSV